MPDFKSLKPFSSYSHEHVKGFLSKCVVLTVDLLQDHQIYCLRACMRVHLSAPEIVTDWGSEGVKHDRAWSLYVGMGHRYVLAGLCARPEISPESNSAQTTKVLGMRQ